MVYTWIIIVLNWNITYTIVIWNVLKLQTCYILVYTWKIQIDTLILIEFKRLKCIVLKSIKSKIHKLQFKIYIQYLQMILMLLNHG